MLHSSNFVKKYYYESNTITTCNIVAQCLKLSCRCIHLEVLCIEEQSRVKVSKRWDSADIGFRRCPEKDVLLRRTNIKKKLKMDVFRVRGNAEKGVTQIGKECPPPSYLRVIHKCHPFFQYFILLFNTVESVKLIIIWNPINFLTKLLKGFAYNTQFPCSSCLTTQKNITQTL